MNFIELRSGKTVEGAEIKALKSERNSNRYIYLMAGVHGDEVEGVYVLQKLFEWLKNNDNVDIPLIVIPTVNVDGLRMGTRVNSNGVDLNRNIDPETFSPEYKQKKYFPGSTAQSEPENKFLVKLFEKYPPKFILSFHSWKPLINYNGDCLEVAKYLSSFNNYEIADDVGYPTPGSLGEYAPKTFASPVITYECPVLSDTESLKDIWAQNEDALKKLLESDLLSDLK